VSKTTRLIRLFPSLTDVIFIMPLIFLFTHMGGAQRLLGDGDTGWHIRTGEWILQHRAVPITDIFSYTKAGEPWFAWEWLWDVAFAWLHRQGGMAAVILASLLVLCLTFVLLFRLVGRNCTNILIGFGVTLCAVAGSTMHWLARPHLFTLLFTVIFLALLERAREGRTRMLLFLPALTILWTNIHAGFIVGLSLIGCYAAGELALWLVEQDRVAAKAALLRSKPYLVTGLACGAATLVNPYFYHLHVYMFRFLRSSVHTRFINEYQGTNFQNLAAPWFEPIFLLGAVAVVWCLSRKRFAHAFMLAGWLHLGLFAVRNVPVYLLVAAPVVGAMLEDLLPRLRTASAARWIGRAVRGLERFTEEIAVMDRPARWHLVSAAVFLIVVSLFYAPSAPKQFRAEYDPKQYPAGALQVLRSGEFAKSVFTEDKWGGYLIYRLSPGLKVFVDSRFDLYGEQFTETYLDLLYAKYGWQGTFNKYGVDTVLLPIDTPLVGALKESSRWRPVYDDGVVIVFRTETALARAAAPEKTRASVARSGDGDVRDREITKTNPRGPRTTDSKRSEPI
jgi:hypothetical protein